MSNLSATEIPTIGNKLVDAAAPKIDSALINGKSTTESLSKPTPTIIIEKEL